MTLRRTPLQRKTRLVAKTAIKRGNSRLSIRRPSVTPEEKAGRGLVSKRSGGWCELRIEGVCAGPARDWQHRRNRSQGGPWAASNGLDTCRPCHNFLHHHPTLAVDNGWTVKSTENWKTRPVVLWDGFFVLGDDGQLYDPPHKRKCAVWTSNDPCDCENSEEAS